ncbi:unnamed protein product [Rotaria sordida]|uniref:Uncharacterized protein n=1 Tax=Rotaria sordida TaxID=392033 RepID=A0A815TVC9_9BILA|nr:unnamed protein product [Rotaria sordida]
MILTDDKQQEILTILHNVENWPGMTFKENRQVRQMLHTRESSTNSAYGLYIPGDEGEHHIIINLQLIEQAAKTTKQMQSVYGVMIGIKYLHEFAHHIYSKYGRSHLLNTYGIQLKDSKNTPAGVLRGESGNKFEEQMLGFVVSHAGHSNIAMNAADLQAFHPDNDDGPVQTAPNVPFSLSDDDMKQDNGDDEDEDEEQLKAFVSLPDKIVF